MQNNNLNIMPANRVQQVKEYYFSRKLKEIAELNAKGADIISLGIGGPDRPPHIDTINTLCQEAQLPNSHGYQSYVGLPELREAFSQWYKRFYNVELNSANEIQPLIGSKEGILHTTLAFVNPGDGVLLPNPGYPTYTSVSRLAEAELYTYDLTEESNWEPDFDALEKLPLDKIKLMWVNYPHMPTGKRASLELFKKLVDFGRKHNIVIVNDNPYSFILNDKPLSIFNIEGAKDIAIEMNSLSKSHNMPGWRIGMLASNPTFIQWILKVKSNIDSGQFRPMMKAAIEALKQGQEWYDDVNSTYAKRRLIAEEIMNTLGCHFDPKQSGLFLWGRIPNDAASSEALADDILYNARVFITPGFIFGSNGDRYIRISLCATEEKMNEALNRIKQLVNNQ
ncbi:MAG: aminotransferase class I/II-fold pyridoxal phosphate-dependent enzyme [Muribaculaceae bacterium]|jgi:aspartate/methionine/tyrosine aminotransferase|nr:aminotransferase class I/II-fold pyridoxal phosphate-dependent enzyme [Muribaculaceae bacterium]MEE1337845.1 aminotransferase class I/II-fold pyridoxal phosphate-dependent enzyme [Muribaculaceae bacterium]